MSISKLSLFTNIPHKKALGHFANIVKIAQIDDVLAESEQKLLSRMAQKLEISNSEYENIIKNPDTFHTNPPVSFDERIERLYYLTKMVLADQVIDEDEMNLLEKTAMKLHFDNSKLISEKAVELVGKEMDLEDFTLEIKKN